MKKKQKKNKKTTTTNKLSSAAVVIGALMVSYIYKEKLINTTSKKSPSANSGVCMCSTNQLSGYYISNANKLLVNSLNNVKNKHPREYILTHRSRINTFSGRRNPVFYNSQLQQLYHTSLTNQKPDCFNQRIKIRHLMVRLK